LQEHQVEPTAEFESHFMKMPYIDESKALMQLDRRRVLASMPAIMTCFCMAVARLINSVTR